MNPFILADTTNPVENPLVLILGAAVVLILSFLFNILTKRTNVPSVLLLMILGFVLQQFADFDQANIKRYVEVL